MEVIQKQVLEIHHTYLSTRSLPITASSIRLSYFVVIILIHIPIIYIFFMVAKYSVNLKVNIFQLYIEPVET